MRRISHGEERWIQDAGSEGSDGSHLSLILWLVGLLTVVGVIHPPNSLGIWSLVIAGALLLLGSVLDGL